MFVEVVVNVMVTPNDEEMTARELGEAAVEAVRNAVLRAEERGHQHRLKDRVSLGMSEVVELRNQLTGSRLSCIRRPGEQPQGETR